MDEAVTADESASQVRARVRSLRSTLGLSQEQLAQRLNVSFATVNRWEAGHHEMSRAARQRFDALAAPPLEAQAEQPRRDSLPREMSSLVPRPALTRAIAAVVASTPLVTLVGPAGSGKTRLAVEVCRFLESAVTFVELSSYADSAAVATAVDAVAAGVLLLDGADRWREDLRSLLATVRARHPELRVVVTSEQALDVIGEQVWPVPMLTCPDASDAAGSPSVSEAGALFVERARSVAPGFEVTAELAPAIAALCAAVDGLPSAVEVLAGWVGTLSLAQLVDRHRELLFPPAVSTAGRVGSLRHAVESSYALLAPPEQTLLRAVSVFADSFTLDDAIAVGVEDAGRTVVSLRHLVDCSWLVVVPASTVNSYRMLRPLQHFAAAKLVEAGAADDVRGRHARHFGALAAASETGLAGVERSEWVTTMTRAGADLDLALAWAAHCRDDELGLAMSGSLWLWWLTTGRLSDGRRWLVQFLAVTASPSRLLAARAHCAAAVLAVESGDYAAAANAATAALAEFERLDDGDGVARAATALASAERYLGHHSVAKRYFELALARRRTLGDDRGLASALNNMALLALDAGELDAARLRFEEALVVKRRLGEPRTVAIGLANVSDVLIRIGRLDPALDSLREAAAIAADLADMQLLATIACNLADAARAQGAVEEAIGHYQVSLDSYRASGGAHDLVPPLCGMARALHATGRTHEALISLREAEFLATSSGSDEHLSEVRRALAEVGESTGLALPDGLTPRQAQILRHLADGSSNKTIAEDLHISVATVERHLATTYRKLGLHGRVDAARYAMRHGLAGPAVNALKTTERNT